jgi:flagellar hook-length control protein FliK
MVNASLKTGNPILSRRDGEMNNASEMNRYKTQTDDFSREMKSVLNNKKEPKAEKPPKEKAAGPKEKSRRASEKEVNDQVSQPRENTEEAGAVPSTEAAGSVKKGDSAEKSKSDTTEKTGPSDSEMATVIDTETPKDNSTLAAAVPGANTNMLEIGENSGEEEVALSSGSTAGALTVSAVAGTGIQMPIPGTGESPVEEKGAISTDNPATPVNVTLAKQKMEGTVKGGDAPMSEGAENNIPPGFDNAIETPKEKGVPASADSISSPKGADSFRRKGGAALKDALIKEEVPERLINGADAVQDSDRAGSTKISGPVGLEKTVKGKGATHKEAVGASVLFAGIAPGEGGQGDQVDAKTLESLKVGMKADEGSPTISLTDKHESRSGGDSSHSNDSGLGYGEGRETAAGQSFRFSEAVEDSKSFERTGEHKMSQTASTRESGETGISTQQSFTIKNHSPSSMALELEPEGLGKLDIELKVTHDQIQGHILVHDAKGKDLIEHNLPHLLSEMAGEGLQIGQFTVSLKNQGREQYQAAFSRSEARSESRPEESGIVPPVSLDNNLIHIII